MAHGALKYTSVSWKVLLDNLLKWYLGFKSRYFGKLCKHIPQKKGDFIGITPQKAFE